MKAERNVRPKARVNHPGMSRKGKALRKTGKVRQTGIMVQEATIITAAEVMTAAEDMKVQRRESNSGRLF